jgi:hypothetical protein
MIGRDERAIPCAAAAEHRQCEHRSISNGRGRVSQIGNGAHTEMRALFFGHPESRRRRGTSQLQSGLACAFTTSHS